ncbi:hypothetical protein Pan1_09 [Pseudanabaena phage Pan1]|nr:hypothetical protein Pan1_09 [Pseudanabaena phage Pan1]
MTMTLEQFVATRRECDESTFAEMQEVLGDDMPARETCSVYADGYLIHEAEGKFWPHAWWYSPVAHDTRESAEANLHKWYLEFN